MIRPEDFDYPLTDDRIAQTPTNPRDAAKLMIVDRKTQSISHSVFSHLTDYLTENDVLVLNDSKVFPARLTGHKESGGATEVLLLRPTGTDEWEAMSRGLKPSQIVRFSNELTGTVVAKNDQTGTVTIRLMVSETKRTIDEVMDQIGQTPIPPYIHSPLSETTLREEYQTIYADRKGSAAAPTAGLHFTDELMKKLTDRGVQIERVTLHVGPGTFAKLRPEQIAAKSLHHEWYDISPDTANRLNKAKAAGKRIIAVGTTACRVLESAVGARRDSPEVFPGSRTTNLFIMPPHQFQFVDGMITNFHLPQSSLLMLVTAFCSAPNTPFPISQRDPFGASLIGTAYQTAIDTNYRFFSFGDAMLIQ